MAAPPLVLLRQERFSSSSSSSSSSIDFDAIKADLASRPAKTILDDLSPMPSHLLNIALSDYIPADCLPVTFGEPQPRKSLIWDDSQVTPSDPFILPESSGPLPLGHHLVYFPLQVPPSKLLPDGTDPAQWPGEPFVRRMWAGGSVTFYGQLEMGSYKSSRAACVERLEDVRVRGPPGAEKIFVDVWRRYDNVMSLMEPGDADVAFYVEESPAIKERRTLVFMRETGEEEKKKAAALAPARIIKAPHEPDYSFTFTPPPSLLFHFSALSYNAHAIHLNPGYAREVEGYRNILVQGPLTLVLMTSILRSQKDLHLDDKTELNIDYRNLAPLYASEPMRVCIRKVGDVDSHEASGGTAIIVTRKKWDIWVEGPEGGLAVRGTATTRSHKPWLGY